VFPHPELSYMFELMSETLLILPGTLDGFFPSNAVSSLSSKLDTQLTLCTLHPSTVRHEFFRQVAFSRLRSIEDRQNAIQGDPFFEHHLHQ
jgi:hypothetical protein